jgi:hypothetical protein
MNGEQTTNIFTRMLQIIDLNTLILISAFVFGLLIIILGISLVICVCKRLNKPKIKLPNTKRTNPLYDTSSNNNHKDIEFKLISSNQDLNNNNNNNNDIEEENEPMNNSNETDKLLQEPTLTVTSSNNTNMNTFNKSNLNNSSLLNTSSSSTSSIYSVILKPQNDSPPPVPSGPPPISTPPSPHIPSTPKTEPVKKSFETNSVKRASIFTPVSAAKSTQQLLQEQKLADSKIPAYKRTISQSNEFNNNNNNNNNNRMSAASSRSSIHQAINFDQIKGDIDDWAVSSHGSHNSSQIIDMDRSDSIPDIYIKEMIRKHEEIKKNKTNNDISLSSSSVNSSFKSNNINNNNGQKNRSGDRRSMNIAVSDINFNTNPTNDLKSSKLDSASVYTVASEKSCY